MRIDFDKIQQRIVSLPLPARSYGSLATGRAGVVFVTEAGAGGRGGGGTSLVRFDLKTRKTETLASGVASFDLSANGDKMLLRTGGGAGGRGGRGGAAAGPQFVIVSSATPVKAGEGALKLTDVEAMVDPVAEWKQVDVSRKYGALSADISMTRICIARTRPIRRRLMRSIWTDFPRGPI